MVSTKKKDTFYVSFLIFYISLYITIFDYHVKIQLIKQYSINFVMFRITLYMQMFYLYTIHCLVSELKQRLGVAAGRRFFLNRIFRVTAAVVLCSL